MRRALLVFIDGLGIGADDPAINPVVAASTPTLDALLGRKLAGITGPVRHDGALLIPTDATQEVAGLPQSATGQTALLTGINAAQAAGRHVTAYPTVAMKELLAEHSIFAQVQRLGRRVAHANAYTPEYFAAVGKGRLRHGAFTHAAMAAGVRLRSIEDLTAGRAVFHDLTNARPRSWGHDVPEITPQEAGRNLAGIACDHTLTSFEFFLTDLAAHGRVPLDPAHVIEMVDGLIEGILAVLDPGQILLIVASDHGNLEDRRGTAHTRNPVPTLLVGEGREAVGSRVRTITDITPAIVGWLVPPDGSGQDPDVPHG